MSDRPDGTHGVTPDARGNVCGAKTRSGGTCRAKPMPNGRCRMHGGLSPGGAAHWNFKDGSRSKYFPRHLRKFVQEAESDPDLISLRRNVEALEVRRRELLKRLCEAADAADADAYEQTWKELLGLNAEDVKTKAAEWKRMADLRLVLPAEQAVMLVEAVMRAIFDIYGRDERLAQLSQRVRALLPPALRPPPS